MRRTQRNHWSRARVEVVEPRCLLANYGNPWPDGSRLTFSFAPDTTLLAGEPTRLFSALDASLPRSEWQRQVAVALQSWAIHADVNVGFRHDGGQAFGATGFTLGDPRFGDVRIGAHEMTSDVLAVSVPYDPARAGTLTGDIFLNSAYRFDGAPYDLMTVLLHEAGHVFGLDHSDDLASPMYPNFNNPIGTLTPGDIDDIRSLYGTRPIDRYDALTPNDLIGDASAIEKPNNYDGSTPLIAFGDLTSADDVDHFKLQTPSDDNGYAGGVTLTLSSSAISLLKPKLTLYSSAGVPIGTSTSGSWLGDTLTLSVDVAADETDFIVRIEGADDAGQLFSIGRYALAASFDARNVVSSETLAIVMTGPHETLDAESLRALLLNSGVAFLNADAGADNSIATARVLEAVASPVFRVEAIGSVENSTDVDHYRIGAPANSTSPLTINLWSVDARGLLPSLAVLNSEGAPVPTTVIANGNRTVTVQIIGPAASQGLILRVMPSTSAVGNYLLQVDNVTPVASLATFAERSLRNSGSVAQDRLWVAESQLMHLLLEVTPDSNLNAVVLMTIRDAEGRVVFSLSARAGESTSGPSVLLLSGEYRVRYEVRRSRFDPWVRESLPVTPASSSVAGAASRPDIRAESQPIAIRDRADLVQPARDLRGQVVRFAVRGSTLSGPVGPSLRNPTLQPRYTHPTQVGIRLYPDGVATRDPFRWVRLIL